MSGLRQLLGGARRCGALLRTTRTADCAERSLFQTQHRGFASGSGNSVTYEGLTIQKPARWHVLTGRGMCSIMWFWIMYRAYYDGEAFLYGHAVHFEHDDDHGDDK